MIRRSLTKQEVEAEPFRVWNAFVDVLAMEDFSNLSPEQRPAHLVFWYESEVQNGGHFQYFENRGTEHLAATVEALGLLGAACQRQVLREAGGRWLSRSRPRIETAEEFCQTALEGEFDSFDSRFHACSPALQQCLEAYLDRSGILCQCDMNESLSRTRGGKDEYPKAELTADARPIARFRTSGAAPAA
jgi:hypothetical protein